MFSGFMSYVRAWYDYFWPKESEPAEMEIIHTTRPLNKSLIRNCIQTDDVYTLDGFN